MRGSPGERGSASATQVVLVSCTVLVPHVGQRRRRRHRGFQAQTVPEYRAQREARQWTRQRGGQQAGQTIPAKRDMEGGPPASGEVTARMAHVASREYYLRALAWTQAVGEALPLSLNSFWRAERNKAVIAPPNFSAPCLRAHSSPRCMLLQ